jgi:hypothetical protein
VDAYPLLCVLSMRCHAAPGLGAEARGCKAAAGGLEPGGCPAMLGPDARSGQPLQASACKPRGLATRLRSTRLPRLGQHLLAACGVGGAWRARQPSLLGEAVSFFSRPPLPMLKLDRKLDRGCMLL